MKTDSTFSWRPFPPYKKVNSFWSLFLELLILNKEDEVILLYPKPEKRFHPLPFKINKSH